RLHVDVPARPGPEAGGLPRPDPGGPVPGQGFLAAGHRPVPAHRGRLQEEVQEVTGAPQHVTSAFRRRPAPSPMGHRPPSAIRGGGGGGARQYGETEDRWALTSMARWIGGNARCGQSSRLQTRQPAPMGVAAFLSFRSRPSAYTVRWACRASQPRPMANILPGRPYRAVWCSTVREIHRYGRPSGITATWRITLPG